MSISTKNENKLLTNENHGFKPVSTPSGKTKQIRLNIIQKGKIDDCLKKDKQHKKDKNIVINKHVMEYVNYFNPNCNYDDNDNDDDNNEDANINDNYAYDINKNNKIDTNIDDDDESNEDNITDMTKEELIKMVINMKKENKDFSKRLYMLEHIMNKESNRIDRLDSTSNTMIKIYHEIENNMITEADLDIISDNIIKLDDRVNKIETKPIYVGFETNQDINTIQKGYLVKFRKNINEEFRTMIFAIQEDIQKIGIGKNAITKILKGRQTKYDNLVTITKL